jgi:hypothetical protein
MATEASTGKLSFEPYKEPLRGVEDGFGYLGAVGHTSDGNRLQCHICGGLYAHLSNHAVKKHGVKSADYRERFQLARLTPLISPNLRERQIAIALAAPPALKQKRLEAWAKAQASVKHSSWRKSLETKNIQGVCPDQLIDKIQMLHKTLGRTPTLAEFRKHYKGLVRAVYQTFGSWNNAVRVANLQVSPRGRRAYYTPEILVEMLQGFSERAGRRPVSSDLGSALPSQYTFHKYFGGFTAALRAAKIGGDTA